MTGDYAAFAVGLFNELERFDEEIAPLGLYGSDDLVEAKSSQPHYQEWPRAILPWLQKNGGSGDVKPFLKRRHVYRAKIDTLETGESLLTVVKISAIKVRQFGSGYQTDKNLDFRERWDDLDLAGEVSALWKQQTPLERRMGSQLVLLIGFDKAQRPFERETQALHASLKWENKGVFYAERIWRDKVGRGFGVKLALWARPRNSQQGTNST